jgi:hypothetical protein
MFFSPLGIPLPALLHTHFTTPLTPRASKCRVRPVARSHSIVEILMFAMCYAIGIVGIVLTFF